MPPFLRFLLLEMLERQRKEQKLILRNRLWFLSKFMQDWGGVLTIVYVRMVVLLIADVIVI